MKLLSFCCGLAIILCGVIGNCYGTNLNCRFVDWGSYTCIVNSLDNTDNNLVITGYTGIHLPNNNDKNVTAIRISDPNTKYIPMNLGTLSKLTGFAVTESQLVEIKSQNFIGMQNLENLNLDQNSLTSVPLDAFSTLPKLEAITLYHNQLEEIPNGVFNNNPQLETIRLSWNKIKFLGSSVFDGLIKLDFVDLRSNVCINILYQGNTTINQLKDDIKSQCKSPYEVKMALTTNPIEMFLFNGQITRVKNELITEFNVATEEQQKKLIQLLTKPTKGEEMEEEGSD